ncbi:MAG: hypothetical protein GY888_15370, partial [Planctomycetaceae bacterium]|nr:hypothetical protein [Planctomycetaceae bacterium]
MIRSFILSIATTSLLAIHALPCDAQQDVHLAMGLRVGEVTQTSAIVWSRVTAQPKRVWPGERRVGRAGKKTAEYTEKIQVDGLEGATPGTPGQLRLFWTEKNDYSKLQTTPWIRVEEKT